MRAQTRVDFDGGSYDLACPLGAFDEICQINPYLRRIMGDLNEGDCNEGLARQITEIGLRYGGSGVTVDEVFDRHGWGVFQILAVSTLLCGFAEEEAEGKPEAVANETSRKKKRPGSVLGNTLGSVVQWAGNRIKSALALFPTLRRL